MSASPATAPAPSGSARARVMIADDSVVVRGLVGRWLRESGFDLVATVADGRSALDALDSAEPDIVLLDLDMPGLDGVAALPAMLAKRPSLSVVVVSTLTPRNAALSLKCLSLGATECIAKPSSTRDLISAASFRTELITKLEALEARHARRGLEPLGGVRRKLHTGDAKRNSYCLAPPRALKVPPRCIVIGASTGGPRAVGEVLSGLGPVIHRALVLVVQHMPPVFTTAFAAHLSAETGIEVSEAQSGEPVVSGRVSIAPGGRHLELALAHGRPVVSLSDGEPVNMCRPSVDVLFRSAAAMFGPATLGVVLTGMGIDGTEGARAVVDAGGYIVAQDQASSVVWGMPGSVARAGLAHTVLPLSQVAPAAAALVAGIGP